MFLLIVGEAFLLSLGGVLLGALIAAASMWLLEGALVQRYGLSLSSPFAGATIVPVLVGLLAAGLAAGLLPAWRCYHRSLFDGLSPDIGG